MEELTQERLCQAISVAQQRYYRLVLIVGSPRSGKTLALHRLSEELSLSVLNVGRLLTEALLELTRKQRALRLNRVLVEMLDRVEEQPLLVDNIEILFDPQLAQDPLRLLQGVARNRVVVSTWPGLFDGTYLTYAEPGHPEWRRYSGPDAVIVPVDGLESGTRDRRIPRAEAKEER